MDPVVWLDEHRINGRLVSRTGRCRESIVAEFIGFGTLVSDRSGQVHRFEADANADGTLVAKFYAGLVDALLRQLQGKLTLHGGAVTLDARAIALIGPSGSGKSTTTAALCRRSGVSMLADDTVAVEFYEDRVDVCPTQTALWIDRPTLRHWAIEAAPAIPTSKVPLQPSSLGTSASLRAIVALEFHDGPEPTSIRKLHGHEAFLALTLNTFRFVVDEPAHTAREFNQWGALAAKVPLYRLRRPRDLGQIEACVDSLLRTISAISP